MPKVSIIVPVYKTKEYLAKCIESIKKQSFTDIEIILVDDGSPDESGALCDSIALSDSRIHVIHKENGGLTSARLAGFHYCTGEYVSFIDSDDYVYPTMIEELLIASENNNAQLAICGYSLIHIHSQQDIFPPWKQDVIEHNQLLEEYQLPLIGRIYDGKHVNIPGFMCIRLFRRELIRDSYFISEREVFTEDDLFNLYYSTSIQRIAVVHTPLYYYVQHPESLSNCYRDKKWEMLCTRYYLCEKWLADNNITSAGEERLLAASFSAIYSALDNAVSIGSYEGFINVFRTICLSDLYQDSIRRIKPKSLSKGQRIIYYLIKLHCWRLLYAYRRRRLKR